MIFIKKKYINIIIIFIIILTILLLYNLINNKRYETTTIEAKILAIGSNYLLVTENNTSDYIIYTKELNYNIGDILEIELKNIDKNKSPYEANAIKISTIEKVNQTQNNQSTNDKENTNNQEQTTPNKNTVQNNENINENKNENINTNNEENIIAYFESLDEELTNYNNDDENIGQKIKSKFVSCIDFIFYNKEINGITFNELTNKTKLKILEITLSIDSKIESKFPDYKKNISSTYQNIKSKIIEKYLEITTNICNEDKELCNNAKESFKNLKNTFGITWEFIKELIGNGTSKLKDWYEIWRYN